MLLILSNGNKRSLTMNKINLLSLTLLLALAGCAETANMTVDRYQFNNLMDDDQDGIINQRDMCLITPLNTKVDNDGCAFWTEVDKISWFPVSFKFDQSSILKENIPQLDRAVEHLQNNSQTKLVLIGDTSGEGELKYNEALAARRNESVKAYLMRKGVQASRIEMQIFDQQTPFTAHLKVRKRRTIAIFIDKDKIYNEAWHIYTTDLENK